MPMASNTAEARIEVFTACATTFNELFPKSLSYKAYTVVFSLFAFGISNVGLSSIIELSLPVLMFLYPLTITLILLCLFGRWFRYDRRVFVSVTVFTALAAALDFLNALPAGAHEALHMDAVNAVARDILPFFDLGMGWVVPACVGLAVGLLLRLLCRKSA